MTGGAPYLRRCSSQHGGRAAVQETADAVRLGVFHVTALKGLSWWQRFLVACLKVVAILGYHWGKWCASKPNDRKSHLTSRRGQEALVDTAIKRSAPAPPPTDERGRQLTLNGRALMAVVIPVFAPTSMHLVRLLAALECLSRQSRQPDYLILVDDGSPLAIPSIISGVRVLVVTLESNMGPAVARNVGLAAARRLSCQLVCFLDADCLPEPNWLGVMERAQRRRPGIVAGRTMASEPSTPVGLYHDVCGTLNGRRMPDGSMLYGCTCNMSLDLSRVDQDFDSSFTEAAFEDVEFCVRARKGGARVAYDLDAVVRHHYEHTVRGLFRQFMRYGRFEARMCERHSGYLTSLWSSVDISCLSDVGLPLPRSANDPPSDKVLCQSADLREREQYEARGPLLSTDTRRNGLAA